MAWPGFFDPAGALREGAAAKGGGRDGGARPAAPEEGGGAARARRRGGEEPVTAERFLDGKTALVTGASRGIGRATALALAARGADVCVHCHERRGLAEEVAGAIEEGGRRSLVVAADVADPGEVAEAVGAVERTFGRLDVLVNNAGFVAAHRLPEARIDVVHRIIDVNLKGPFHCIAAALPLLRAARGVIVNVGARGSRALSAGGPAYAAAKAGLVAMTRNLAHDLGPLGVRINTIAPPLTRTDMGRWAVGEAGSPRAGLEDGQRAADPAEVAEAIALFCSPGMAYLSGETLYLGGGFEERPSVPPPPSD